MQVIARLAVGLEAARRWFRRSRWAEYGLAAVLFGLALAGRDDDVMTVDNCARARGLTTGRRGRPARLGMRAAAVIALALWVSACAVGVTPMGQGTATPPAPALTETPLPAAGGIEGQILIGPACPGPVSLESPCPDQPYQAKVKVLDALGQEVEAFESDPAGYFRVPLPPGTYTLVPLSPNSLSMAVPLSVTVQSGGYTSVTITYDSGMR